MTDIQKALLIFYLCGGEPLYWDEMLAVFRECHGYKPIHDPDKSDNIWTIDCVGYIKTVRSHRKPSNHYCAFVITDSGKKFLQDSGILEGE